MKQYRVKITAILMALVVLLSTMSFTIDMHFCGGFLVDAALFSRADSCGSELDESFEESCSVEKKDCCSNENFTVEGQDELHFDVFKYSLTNQQLFVASFVQSYIGLLQSLPKQYILPREYSPPNTEADIQVLHQVFII